MEFRIHDNCTPFFYPYHAPIELSILATVLKVFSQFLQGTCIFPFRSFDVYLVPFKADSTLGNRTRIARHRSDKQGGWFDTGMPYLARNLLTANGERGRTLPGFFYNSEIVFHPFLSQSLARTEVIMLINSLILGDRRKGDFMPKTRRNFSILKNTVN